MSRHNAENGHDPSGQPSAGPSWNNHHNNDDEPRFAQDHPANQQPNRWSETAWQWYQRYQEQRASFEIPQDPSSAAWSFIRKPNTGIPFVNSALRQPRLPHHLTKNNNNRDTQPSQLPQEGTFLEIRGTPRTGKTTTLVTLAAQFVVATSPSNFQSPTTTPRSNNHAEQPPETIAPSHNLPQVVILDGNQDITATRLACAVRSLLLRKHDNNDNNNNATTNNNNNNNNNHNIMEWLDKEIHQCLHRIHIIFPEDSSACMFSVSVLESLYYKLSSHGSSGGEQPQQHQQQQSQQHQQPQHPTLVLWDGFTLGGGNHDYEIGRQLKKLVYDCSIVLVTTVTTTSTTITNTSSSSPHLITPSVHDKFVTHRLRLEQQYQSPQPYAGTTTSTPHHEYCAVLPHETHPLPFSISLGGILS